MELGTFAWGVLIGMGVGVLLFTATGREVTREVGRATGQRLAREISR